jgi:hypothetical protein
MAKNTTEAILRRLGCWLASWLRKTLTRAEHTGSDLAIDELMLLQSAPFHHLARQIKGDP